MGTDKLALIEDEPEGARPQDVGRRHKRTRPASAASLSLLERYNTLLRSELEAVIADMAGTDTGQLDLSGAPVVSQLALAERVKRMEYGRLLVTQLGSAGVDPAPAIVGPSPAPRGPRRARVDFG